MASALHTVKAYENLRRADEARLYRAELKRRLAHRELELRYLLLAGYEGFEDVDVDVELAGGLRLRSMLLSVPRIADTKARKIIREMGLDSDTRLERLTLRQRTELAEKVYRYKGTHGPHQ